MKKLMTGNEALVQGAWEAGVLVASAYPGTPSTEIIENMSARKEIYSEWAPNEKVAMEAAIGASIAGVRSLAAMKHVGLNVAADPLFTFVYTGVNGGMVLQELFPLCRHIQPDLWNDKLSWSFSSARVCQNVQKFHRLLS